MEDLKKQSANYTKGMPVEIVGLLAIQEVIEKA